MKMEKGNRELQSPLLSPIELEIEYTKTLDILKSRWEHAYQHRISFSSEEPENITRWSQIGLEITTAYLAVFRSVDAHETALLIGTTEQSMVSRDDALLAVGLYGLATRDTECSMNALTHIHDPRLRTFLFETAVNSYCLLDDVTQNEIHHFSRMSAFNTKASSHPQWNGDEYPQAPRAEKLTKNVRIVEPLTPSHFSFVLSLTESGTTDGFAEALTILHGAQKTFDIGYADPQDAIEAILLKIPSDSRLRGHIFDRITSCTHRPQAIRLIEYYLTLSEGELQIISTLINANSQLYDEIFLSNAKPTVGREHFILKNAPDTLNVDDFIGCLFRYLNSDELSRWLPEAVNRFWWPPLNDVTMPPVDIRHVCTGHIPSAALSLTYDEKHATGIRFAQYVSYITTPSAYDRQYLDIGQLRELRSNRIHHWAWLMDALQSLPDEHKHTAYMLYYQLGDRLRTLCNRPIDWKLHDVISILDKTVTIHPDAAQSYTQTIQNPYTQ